MQMEQNMHQSQVQCLFHGLMSSVIHYSCYFSIAMVIGLHVVMCFAFTLVLCFVITYFVWLTSAYIIQSSSHVRGSEHKTSCNLTMTVGLGIRLAKQVIKNWTREPFKDYIQQQLTRSCVSSFQLG